MKIIFLLLSVIISGFGIYLVYFYDVPDTKETINFFTGWFLVITGIASLLVNMFWNKSGSKE
jgi:uncharacterized membrane protein HdeD (DUF308 family)